MPNLNKTHCRGTPSPGVGGGDDEHGNRVQGVVFHEHCSLVSYNSPHPPGAHTLYALQHPYLSVQVWGYMWGRIYESCDPTYYCRTHMPEWELVCVYCKGRHKVIKWEGTKRRQRFIKAVKSATKSNCLHPNSRFTLPPVLHTQLTDSTFNSHTHGKVLNCRP